MDNNDKIFQSIAVLIDGDNALVNSISTVISKISTFGRITIKRVYGNWKKSHLAPWEKVIKNLALKAQQQFDYVIGKNATDIAMVIDAMKLLYTGKYDAFAIISSDSDYTPLCIELRESGIFVIGVGRDDSSDAFKRSCDEFVSLNKLMQAYDNSSKTAENEAEEDSSKTAENEAKEDSPKTAENEVQEDSSEKAKSAPVKASPRKTKSEETPTAVEENTDEKDVDEEDASTAISDKEKELHQLLKIAAETENWQDDDGFVNVAGVGDFIKRTRPEFDITQFGFKKLPDFIAAHTDLYEMKRYKGKGSVYIRAYKCK